MSSTHPIMKLVDEIGEDLILGIVAGFQPAATKEAWIDEQVHNQLKTLAKKHHAELAEWDERVNRAFQLENEADERAWQIQQKSGGSQVSTQSRAERDAAFERLQEEFRRDHQAMKLSQQAQLEQAVRKIRSQCTNSEHFSSS